MLSNACKSSIRAVLYLAIYTNDTQKAGVREIADKLETPQPFLAKLLQQLAKNNLVSSAKGPNGGFFLREENLENSVWDIISSVDGTEKLDKCFLGLLKCTDENPCPVHFIVSPFKEKVLEQFRDKTIAQFANEIKGTGKVISLKDLGT